jgi:dTDP-4-amino-4,6-dideoxygalactose transaminase
MVRPTLPSFDELAGDVQGVLASGMVTKGRHLSAFEAAVADHLEVKHVVAVSSCTTGLMLAYQAAGLYGEVVVPSFTFMATVSALVWAGLTPVFADVDPGTTNLSPAAAEAAVTERTSALVAVHNFGNPADVDALQRVADDHGLALVFDAAHGFGATYQGTPVGTQGLAQVFSLSPTKLLIAGEGGIVATNDDAIANHVRKGREYGNNGRYDSAFAGLNGRLAEFNAILGLRSLRMLETAARRRNEIAAIFRERLLHVPGIRFQEVRPGCRSSYKDLSIVVDPTQLGLTRDELAAALQSENIDTRKYYDPAVHQQAAYRKFHFGQVLPATDELSANSLSLPIWSTMEGGIAERICDAVSRIHEHAEAIHSGLALS